jgi:SAM-dependent methyltransferase
MPFIPDFTDPRYLDEIGWFLYHEKNHYGGTDRSYAADRLTWSEMFLKDLLDTAGRDPGWIEQKSVVSIGSGCSGDLAAWPAASKIAMDPVIYAYQKLGMLIPDSPGTNPTVYLSVGIEDTPLLDACADVVLCRNVLDHMHNPRLGLAEMWRILKPDGRLFLWVDIGGEPTPDEPSPFTRQGLMAVLEEHFEVLTLREHRSHSRGRDYSLRILARNKPGASTTLDKQAILDSYERSIGAHL